MASLPTSESSRSMSGSKSSLDTLDDGTELTISHKALEAIRVIKRELKKAKSNDIVASNSKDLMESSLCPIKSSLCKIPVKDWPVLFWKRLRPSGYSLVQEAILSNNITLLSDILKLCSVNLNLLKCSQEDQVMYPLHLACRLGFAEIISMLLDRGATLTKASRVIPPNHMMDDEIFRLSSQKLVPLWHALLADQVSSLEVLLSHRRSSFDLRPLDALKAACSAGATKCVQWLLSKAENDSDFCTVLFYKKNMVDVVITLVALSVKKEIVHILKHNHVLLGCLPATISLGTTIALDQLHKVYSQPQCINLHAATDFLVAFIKARATQEYLQKILLHKESSGNTPLHVLCQRHQDLPEMLLYYSASFVGGLGSEEAKSHFLQDHVTCLTLLLNLGANPQMVNEYFKSPAELLFPVVARKLNEDYLEIGDEKLDTLFLELLVAQLQKLLIHSDGTHTENKIISQLLTLACQLTSSSFSFAGEHTESNLETITHIIDVLLKHGCDPNCRDRNGKTGVYNLMYNVWYAGVQTEFKSFYLKIFNKMLYAFIEHGLRIHDVLPQVNRYYLGDSSMNGKDKVSSCTYLCEAVGMLRDTFPPNFAELGHSERQQLHQQLSLLIMTLLRYGASDVVSLLTEERFLPGANVEYVCSSLLEELVYLYLGGYSNGVPKFNEQYLTTLLFLVHNFIPISQWQLFSFVLQEKLEAFDINIWNGLTFWQERVGVVLKSALSSPSSLKQQVRIEILQSIGWNLPKGVHRLPINVDLQRYLLFDNDWNEMTQQLCKSRVSDF